MKNTVLNYTDYLGTAYISDKLSNNTSSIDNANSSNSTNISKDIKTSNTIAYQAVDYTSKKVNNIRNMPELNDTNYIEYAEMYNNQTIEQISYILYGTPNYWDLLLIINDKNPLFDMSYDFNILQQVAINSVNKYLLNYSGKYKSNTVERLTSLLTYEQEAKNEQNRQIKVIKPNMLNSFLNALKNVKL